MADWRGKEGPIGTSSTTARLAHAGSPRPWAILATARSQKGAAPAPCAARNGRDVDAVADQAAGENIIALRVNRRDGMMPGQRDNLVRRAMNDASVLTISAESCCCAID
jgi:hypothetical protein